jgi:hypothetical protein
MELSKTMVTWVESLANSCLVAFFVKSFPWNIGFACLVFFLVTISHIMIPCAVFNFFEPPLAKFQI